MTVTDSTRVRTGFYARYPFPDARSRALSEASARRELWERHHRMSTPVLCEQLAIHLYCLTDHAMQFRSENLRHVDTWYVRMITSELRRRAPYVSPDALFAIGDRVRLAQVPLSAPAWGIVTAHTATGFIVTFDLVHGYPPVVREFSGAGHVLPARMLWGALSHA